jgi:hypothetical protein
MKLLREKAELKKALELIRSEKEELETKVIY